MERYKLITIIATVVILLGAALYFGVNRLDIQNSRQANEQGINFRQLGNVFKDSPGLKPGVWYLSYEQPGSPGLKRELKFTEQHPDLHVGLRVYLEGHETNEVVEVSKLEILNAYKSNLIWVESPLPNDTVINPITITGWARGNWYFEASFPIKVLDAKGALLGQTTAQAQGNWMTGDYVQFMASLPFSAPSTPTGTLVLEKDNPSGLPQNADELRIPVKFGTEGRAVKLYYYNSDKDKDAQGNILCSRQGLVAVERQIPITTTPIQDTIKLLLQGKIDEQEKSQGITTEYPLPELELLRANLANDVLTLEFKDSQNKTVGGSCRVGILWFQIEATVKQYPGVKQVKFKPEELFQP